jgi:hypothetical protein
MCRYCCIFSFVQLVGAFSLISAVAGFVNFNGWLAILRATVSVHPIAYNLLVLIRCQLIIFRSTFLCALLIRLGLGSLRLTGNNREFARLLGELVSSGGIFLDD